MAHLHFKRTVYAAGGTKAWGRLEYITRAPKYEPGPERGQKTQQERYKAKDREDLVYTRSRNLPRWAEGNPYIYFQAAERYEVKPKQRQVGFEEWKITLPREFTRQQNMALMHDLVREIAGDTLPITYAFHDPKTLDDTGIQPHLHLLISARCNDGIVRTPEQHFRRFNRNHPEIGGAEKDRAFGRKGAVMHHRILIADVINYALEREGERARVHPGTLKSRGIMREPEPKLLPSESRVYRAHGIITPAMQHVLDIRAARTRSREREDQQARLYWDTRKRELGLDRDLGETRSLERIRAARGRGWEHPNLITPWGRVEDRRGTATRQRVFEEQTYERA